MSEDVDWVAWICLVGLSSPPGVCGTRARASRPECSQLTSGCASGASFLTRPSVILSRYVSYISVPGICHKLN